MHNNFKPTFNEEAIAILNEFKINSENKIYSINTTTGAASAVSNYPNAVRGFALGLGF